MTAGPAAWVEDQPFVPRLEVASSSVPMPLSISDSPWPPEPEPLRFPPLPSAPPPAMPDVLPSPPSGLWLTPLP
jgi:hypothetical protein